MPELNWDPLDFLECLDVEPEVKEDYKTQYEYVVERDGLRQAVSIWPHESVINIDLSRANGLPVIAFALYVRGEVVYGKDQTGEYLEMRHALPVPGRFSYIRAKGLHSREQTPFDLTFRLRVKPQIQLKYLHNGER